MAEFMFRFLICNLWIGVITGILLAVRHFFHNCLTSRMKYHLWFFLPVFLTIPFLPLPSVRLPQISAFLWIRKYFPTSASGNTLPEAAASHPSVIADWMNDFSISVSRKAPSGIGQCLFCLWIAGILCIAFFLLRAALHLHTIRQSALPLQNHAVRRLYDSCLDEMQIKKNIPVYSTAFLKSPVITGYVKPRIYLPIHLFSDFDARQIRYMLLHELCHYRHKDTLVNHVMNLAVLFYWFNPFVWYALHEMHSDREAACDTSVLKMLPKDAYQDYGNTLLDLAEKISTAPFPFTAGIGTGMTQMKKRILNIAGYHPLTKKQKIQSTLACLLTAVILSGFLPLLSIPASDSSHYAFRETGRNISYLDLTKEFGSYNGSFVLYDTADDSWHIYQKDNALTRTAPASTYKIYSALLGLETSTITPENSHIRWNGQTYMYDSWNLDQNLTSAMRNSVNWYFQTLDAQIGLAQIKNYIHQIGYGNQTVTGDTDTYWLNGDLKISPAEQVEMLQKFYHNTFGFAPEHIEAVKRAIQLESTQNGTLYGKTGTETVDGKNISGWLVGWIEKNDRTCFFAINIQKEDHADGTAAAQLALTVLSKLYSGLF